MLKSEKQTISGSVPPSEQNNLSFTIPEHVKYGKNIAEDKAMTVLPKILRFVAVFSREENMEVALLHNINTVI